YQVLPDATGADGVLKAILISADRRALTFTANNQAASYAITITANVEFRDAIDDKVLWTNPTFRSSDEYQVAAGSAAATSSDPTAIFTQVTNAQDRLTKKFAREVVSSIFEAF
ncbi:MAG TPA: LPS assembly lipoprotein LptE, partial [Vicinamibacterales bacterium]|nr:LPS assembly lipoprotein LptE [Vicinamibacterales bacterium]